MIERVEKPIIVNHVMSRDIESGIFTAILSYFKEYSPDSITHIETVRPIESADIYHYHRPHLEKKLLSNSVCTVHHDLNDPDPWHARGNFVPRYMEAKGIFCLNSIQKKILKEEEGFDLNKLFLIPHGYNNVFLNEKNKLENDKFVIGVASKRYGRRVKGEAYLYELVKRLDYEKIKFILVGEDRNIDAEALRDLGFEVDVFDRLPYRVFNSFYNAIDVLLMCSSYEGGPANIPEALATATPILSSRIGMANDAVEHGVNGYFLSLNPDADSNLIMDLVNDSCIYQNLRSNCLNMTEKALTWQQCVAMNVHAYLKIIKDL